RADVLVGDARIVECLPPPSFILRAQPCMKQSDPGRTNRMRLHCRRGGKRVNLDPQLGGGVLDIRSLRVLDDERATVELLAVRLEWLLRGFDRQIAQAI